MIGKTFPIDCDGDDALEQLGCPVAMPTVDFFHPLIARDGEDGPEVILCVHDETNERATTLAVPQKTLDKFPDADAVQKHVERICRAEFN